MAFMRVDCGAASLGMCMETCVIMPEETTLETPAKVLYLLHGLSDDQTIWDRFSSVERYADGHNICVVMPTGHTSFYTDSKNGNYWSFVSRDVPDMVEHTFNVSKKREDTFVAGLSMGGYGALKLGLLLPDKFGKVFAMSSAVNYEHTKSLFEGTKGIFPDEKREQNDLDIIAEKLISSKSVIPELHIYCGKDDFLYQDNVKFCNKLSDLGVAHEFIQDEGYTHEWRYWEKCIEQIINIISCDK